VKSCSLDQSSRCLRIDRKQTRDLRVRPFLYDSQSNRLLLAKGQLTEGFIDRERQCIQILRRLCSGPSQRCCDGLLDLKFPQGTREDSPPAPVVKRQPRIAVREPGSGRPTKRERRELDRLRRP